MKKDKWKVSFGRVKSVDPSQGAVFKHKPKPNPYIKGARYRALPGISTKGKTESEAY